MTFSLYVRLILSTETSRDNQKNNSIKQQAVGKGKISRITTLLDSNVQLNNNSKNHKVYKEIGKKNMAHSREKNKSTEIFFLKETSWQIY